MAETRYCYACHCDKKKERKMNMKKMALIFTLVVALLGNSGCAMEYPVSAALADGTDSSKVTATESTGLTTGNLERDLNFVDFDEFVEMAKDDSFMEEFFDENLADKLNSYFVSDEPVNKVDDFTYSQDGDVVLGVYCVCSDVDADTYHWLLLRSLDAGSSWQVSDEYIWSSNTKWKQCNVAVKEGYSLVFVDDYAETLTVYAYKDNGNEFIGACTNEEVPHYTGLITPDNIKYEISGSTTDEMVVYVDMYSKLADSDAGAFESVTLFLVDGSIVERNTVSAYADFMDDYDWTEKYFYDADYRLLDKALLKQIFGEAERVVGKAEVRNMLRLGINEIYAAKGYDFTNTKYASYFNNRCWYKPVAGKTISEGQLNAYEKYNIDLLVEVENEYK